MKKLKYVFRVSLTGGAEKLVSGNAMSVNNRGDLMILRDENSGGYNVPVALAVFKTNSWVQASIVDESNELD